MPRSSRSRVLFVLLLLFATGTAAAFFSGNLPYLPWDQPITDISSGDGDAAVTEPVKKSADQNRAAKADQAAEAPRQPSASTDDYTAGMPELTSPGANARKDFDVATIDPNGVSVFAGSTAQPNARVSVFADGVEIGTTNSNADGEWTLVVENKLKSANPKLSVSSDSEQAAIAATADPASDASQFIAGQTAGGTEGARPSLGADARPPADVSRQQADAAAAAGLKENGNRKFAKVDNLPSVRDIQAGFMRNLEQLVETARSTSEDRRTALVVPAVASQSRSTETRPDENYARGPNPDPMPPKPVPFAKAREQISVLIPVAFIFREPNLTPEGQRAAALLLEYVKLKRFKSLTLTGHADERGSPELNMELSRNRLQTVAGILKNGGYSGELNLVAKGKSEPFQGVDRSRFSQEDLYQLDRRVELLASR